MTCNNCARHVTEALQGVAGVSSATVSLEEERASVRWQADAPENVEAAIKAVEAAGFEAKVRDAGAPDHARHRLAGWQLNLWLGIPATALLMLGEWAFRLDMTPWFRWFSFALAGVVQVFAGARFYRGAWNQLKVRSSNMDTLVALGSTTAFGYSAWALLSGYGGHLYFMEAAAIITLISTGHWLESLVSVRASSALRKLMNLAPAKARRRLPDGTEVEVPIAELEAGDVVVLRPGDRVATDGKVLEGDSAVDESMLTGESTPVDKAPKSPLYAGTLNLNGALQLRVTATGEATALAQIIAAVQRAQTSRANIQRLGDRVSNVFVPLVIAVALAAGLWWGLAPASANAVHAWLAHFIWFAPTPAGPLAAAFITAAAVLIIACPCAMGLATPAAIMAGANAAARRGILIRDGVALERAGNVSTVLFDKTGTLTLGKPAVVKSWETGSPRPSAAQLAAGLARHSNHPISQAVARLSADGLELAEWKEVRGAGVQAKLDMPALPERTDRTERAAQARAVTARLGSLRWLKESGTDLAAGDEFIRRWAAEGATIVGVSVANSLIGLFAVKDTIKPGAREVVERLHRQGLKTYLVTGDNQLTATSLARQAAIPADHVFAEVLPDQKADLVKRLQQQGQQVAFVGDGINDAPALEQADLGIAVARANDIAREAADIILLNSEIEAVPESLGLARAALRTIKQNLFWAFFYNALGVPLAALGFMSPILCAAAMGVSDLVVIGNALRLHRWRLRG
jgi:Cu+-exporting ATPase